jgi:hypothetical protein
MIFHLFNKETLSMRNTLIAVVFAVIASVVAQSASAQGTAVYDPATGNIKLTGVAGVGGIQVKGPNLDLDPAPDALGGFVDTGISGEISWLFFTPKAGEVGLGNLFPTQLRQNVLDSSYFAGVVIAGSGVETPVGLQITGGLPAIPEPASIAMASLGVIGFLAMRRRNA